MAMDVVKVGLPLLLSGGFAGGGRRAGGLESAAGHHPDF